MSKPRNEDLELLMEEILTDAYGDEEQLWAFRQAFEDNIPVPCAATVIGEPVQVTKFDFDGNARTGLTATCRRPNGAKYKVAVADVVLADAAMQSYIAAYRKWMGIAPAAAPKKTRHKPVR